MGSFGRHLWFTRSLLIHHLATGDMAIVRPMAGPEALPMKAKCVPSGKWQSGGGFGVVGRP